MAAPAEPTDWIQRMRDLRRLMGWSQRRLARELRVSPGAVSQWESGQRPISGPVQRLIELYEQSLGMVDPPAPGGLRKINGSWAFRTVRVSTTAARAASRLAGSSLATLIASHSRALEIRAATQAAIAHELAESLGEMKGLAMKLGQMASYLEFVPPHIRKELASLRTTVQPMAPSAVDTVFMDSMGSPPERVFDHWERRPLAAASIGQVHRARLPDGTQVAVKVQYPEIRRAVEADLSNVAALARLSNLLFRRQDREALIGEFRERLLEECDYEREASNQEEFGRIFGATPGVVIPRVYRDFSTPRILCTELIDGQSFSSFAEQADQALKDRAAEIIFRVATSGIFQHGIFNADPHPGNYLFLESGEVAFLDFGCVKRFSPDLVHGWTRYSLAVTEGRCAESHRLLEDLGFVEDPADFDFDHHYEMVRQLHEPFISEQPFRFTEQFVRRIWQRLMVDNPDRLRIRVPPDFMFVNRLHWGLFSVLTMLRAQASWRAIYDEIMTAALRRPDSCVPHADARTE